MFGLFQKREILDEQAVIAALGTTETLMHNMIVRLPGLGLSAELSDAQIAAVEAFTVGAFSVLLNTACNRNPQKPLPDKQGRELLKYLAMKMMSSLKFGMLYETSASGTLSGMNGDRLVDRLIVAMHFDPKAYELGVESARDLVGFFNGEGPELDYERLSRLLGTRKSSGLSISI